MGPMGLVACSSDGVSENIAPSTQHELPMMVTASAVPHEEGSASRGTNRSWTAPAGYYLYDDLYSDYANNVGVEHSGINVIMTHDRTGEGETPCPLYARLRYSPAPEPSISKWKLSLPNDVEIDAVKGDDYYAYGFIPSDAASGATITKLPEHSDWADGAVLTIQGLKAVANDPCVIIGAKEGVDENTCTGLQAGHFEFNLKTGTTGEPPVAKPNYLYFLFDHLYSALSISMRVNSEYHALRRIKLKGLYLKTKTTSGSTPEKTDVTITLVKNDAGTTPISNITYEASAGDETTDGKFYTNSEGYPLTTAYSKFLGHFMPQGVSTLILTSVYDVYDTNDNLIRKDCRATNTMLLSDLFDRQVESERGWKYQVNLTINPTYLYMMSEPDLDNPTVVVN